MLIEILAEEFFFKSSFSPRVAGTPERLTEDGISVGCLCPSMVRTPILDGFTKEKLDDMVKSVGGLMPPEQLRCRIEPDLLQPLND